jgi:hypothetical protein
MFVGYRVLAANLPNARKERERLKYYTSRTVDEPGFVSESR